MVTVPDVVEDKTAYRMGYDKCRQEVLDYLATRWLGEEAPDRDLPESKYFLDCVRELAQKIPPAGS
jgi:hypothetical protein